MRPPAGAGSRKEEPEALWVSIDDCENRVEKRWDSLHLIDEHAPDMRRRRQQLALESLRLRPIIP